MSSRTSARFIIGMFAKLIHPPNNLSRLLPSNGNQIHGHQRFVAPNSEYQHVSRAQVNFQNLTSKRNFCVYNDRVPSSSFPSGPPPSSRLKNWIIGIMVSIILPFAGNKLGPFLQFKKEVDTAVETVEEIADVVEKVAEVVEKLAEGISDELPSDGNMKKVVDIVEKLAEKTAKDAHAVDNVINKFQEVEVRVDNIVGKLSDIEHNVSVIRASQQPNSGSEIITKTADPL